MQRTVRPAAHVVTEVLDGEAVLLNLESGRYYTLNPTGTRMWQLLCEMHEPQKVLTALVGEYPVEPGTLSQHLDELVAALVEAGLACDDRG